MDETGQTVMRLQFLGTPGGITLNGHTDADSARYSRE